jgi:hypothetical protein
MEALDLKLEEKEFQVRPLVNCGPVVPGQQLSEVVTKVGFPQSTCWPLRNQIVGDVESFNLGPCLDSLVNQQRIREVVGARTLDGQSVAQYSTFASAKPKPYFSVYVELLKRIRSETNLAGLIWIEDLVSLPRFGWSLPAMNDAAGATRDWFKSQNLDVPVRLSSGCEERVIPLDFVRGTLSRSTLSEFIELLPFHKRDLGLVTISDLAHFLWSLYVFSCFPGLHLTAANSKRNYLLFRKLCGKKYTVALIPPVL